MTIHHENKKHQFFCEGPSRTEKEHAERCDINYQIKRTQRGLPPNWGNDNVKYGYEKMDNSLTDHLVEMEKLHQDIQRMDLSDIPDQHYEALSDKTKNLYKGQREQQKNAKKTKTNANLPPSPTSPPVLNDGTPSSSATAEPPKKS